MHLFYHGVGKMEIYRLAMEHSMSYYHGNKLQQLIVSLTRGPVHDISIVFEQHMVRLQTIIEI